ncbi:MAG: hypothetical protein A3J28_06030 [Acidobacteria bacterium RIFCSPLOWO2_12_FULL_60_22]|nr:MAG: hypothetical protein A3J28_06030 [Acidobacteria bacterium RIFCSPLOWO2_12_FULL_60_22]
MLRKVYKLGFAVVGVILMVHFSALAQTSTGSISGVVQDESGAVIPGATVTITDVDTGISRSVVSDAGGRYRVPSLIPDRYEVQAQMTGFETGVRKGIQLTVGGDLEINMALRVGQVTQTTVVTAEAPLVETMTGTISGLVDDKAIRDLPLNGRSFDQLIALQSSAPQIRIRNSSSIVAGVGSVYAVHGARDQANRFLLDGTEVLQAGFQTDMPGGALGLNMGVEGIREFSVLTSNYGAAYGKKMGAIINMATRSGANQFHGSAFEFLRNSALDARNFFDRRLPPFRRNQFGGALGGPIRRDQTFFFGTYEGLRQNLGLSVIDTVPDPNARQGLVPDRQNPGQFINVGVAPAVRPYLALYPLPNGRIFGDGTAEIIFSPTRLSTQNFYLGRVDHRLSDKDSLFARYNFSNSKIHHVSDIIYWGLLAPSSIQLLTLQETRAYSTTVNTIRAGFNRSTLANDSISTVPVDPSLFFLPGARGLGGVSFSASATAGGGATGGGLTNRGTTSTESAFAINQFSLGDELFHQRGAHSFQLGVQGQRIQQNQRKPDVVYGSFQFIDLTGFLTGRPRNFAAPTPGVGIDSTKGYRQTYLAAYLQDDYKVRRNVTLNLGLRWEFMTPPTEASGNRISNYHVQVVNGVSVLDTSPTLGSPFYESHKKSFAPRLGFAWDILGDGKTAVRGGFGMFYDQIETEFKARTGPNLPFWGTVQVANPPFPAGFSGGASAPALPAPEAIDFGLSVPVRLQYNVNVQRQITSNTVITIGYVGSEAYHLIRMSDLNTAVPQILADGTRFYPAGAPRVNPALASSQFISSDATSSYQGLDLEVAQRFSHGLRYKVSFTYAKTIDSASAIVGDWSIGASTTTMQADNLGRDRGLSSFDVRRNLVGNLTYDLPWQNSARAAARWIGGWQVSGIVTLSDGMPFTASSGFRRSQNQQNTVSDRPNLLPGKSKNPILGGPDRYYDPTVFALPPAGFYGNLGRNTLITPGFATVDFTLTKVIPVRERLKMDFRAEFFNLLNRANFGLPGRTIFNSGGAIIGAAGRITSTVNTSRQIQFGLKLLF